MADTAARIGYGTVLEIALATAPTAFTFIRETFSATPPSDTDDQVDATHFQSPNRYREFIPGLTDAGEASFEMNYVPGSATDRFLNSIKGKRIVCRLTFPNGVQIIFSASRGSYEKDVPIDDKMTATLTLKVSGEPVITEIAAPINLLVPSISGTPKVGLPLTVDGGAWAGAMELTYQWKVAAAVVAGATGSSYVPVVGDATKTVTVAVTGTNDGFTTVVTSAATSAVAA
ncbi:histidine kinase [Mesorhizobium sp. NBSH29]|uniref:phage tail tube protein n=1 Tax=Mesorhizobium sp. NBSH29 TaxID=2654249 RepID=UPI001896804C|nr:phage tail tube protein [Mesorhizobium sp. NBSH29]QPC87416.1 histidine kinase [Mesorhizobium sp. NBSH29]